MRWPPQGPRRRWARGRQAVQGDPSSPAGPVPAARQPRSRPSLLEDQAGAMFVEYIAIVILVAIAVMAAWSLLEDSIEDDARENYTTFGTPPDG